MITSLYIKNLAIIDELKVEFENGLNIITGETGSGKTIIVNAISYLLGGRFSKDHMRTDSKKTIIEANFQTEKKHCIIRRVITANGNSRIFVDEEPVKLNVLPQISKKFIDLYGQHEHQRLLSPIHHLSYVDEFGNYDHLLAEVFLHFNDLQTRKSELNAIQKIQSRLDEKRDLYNFQLKELEKYELEEDLDSKLSIEYETLVRSSEIIHTLDKINIALEESENSIVSKINKLKSSLSKISHINETMLSIENRFDSSALELSDLSQEVNSVKSSISVDENRLHLVEEKLSHIEMLKRKFGGSMLNVIDYRNKISDTLLEEKKTNEKIPKLEIECKRIQDQLEASISLLTDARMNAMDRLSKIVTSHISGMDMKSTKFHVKLWPSDKITELGNDACEFFIQTNLGEEPRPLAKVASGGELSRIMLAVKLALQKSDKVDTLIFDEKLMEYTLENDFLAAALSQASLLSAKR